MCIQVKICGITTLSDAEIAVDAGADLIGFIFYAKSPRYVEPETARQIVAALRRSAPPEFSLRTVGVFVNTPPDQVKAILDHAELDYAQLHGDEPPADLAALAGRGFKALRPSVLSYALDQAAPFVPYPDETAPQLLIDAHTRQAYGGTGQRADWIAAAQLARCYPRLLLAGGLEPDNVAAALAAVHPWGVDVSSGVEASPGRKDQAKVRAFVAAARDAARSQGVPA